MDDNPRDVGTGKCNRHPMIFCLICEIRARFLADLCINNTSRILITLLPSPPPFYLASGSMQWFLNVLLSRHLPSIRRYLHVMARKEYVDVLFER